MRRALAIVGVLGLAVGSTPADAGRGGKASTKSGKSSKKRGKVVRVERTKLDGPGRIVVCTGAMSDGRSTCYGQPPASGDVGVVLDETGAKGRVRVNALNPGLDSCGNTTSWEVQGQVVDGDLSQLQWNGVVMFDRKPGDRSKVIQQTGQVVMPGRYPNEQFLTAVDDNDDLQPDLLVTWHYCDPAGNATPSQGGAYCLVYWTRVRSQLEQHRLDVVKNC